MIGWRSLQAENLRWFVGFSLRWLGWWGGQTVCGLLFAVLFGSKAKLDSCEEDQSGALGG